MKSGIINLKEEQKFLTKYFPPHDFQFLNREKLESGRVLEINWRFECFSSQSNAIDGIN